MDMVLYTNITIIDGFGTLGLDDLFGLTFSCFVVDLQGSWGFNICPNSSKVVTIGHAYFVL